MKWLLRSVLTACLSSASLAQAQPARLAPPLEPARPSEFPLTVLPPAPPETPPEAPQDVAVVKPGISPHDVSTPKPATTRVAVQLPKPPVNNYPLPAIPPLPPANKQAQVPPAPKSPQFPQTQVPPATLPPTKSGTVPPSRLPDFPSTTPRPTQPAPPAPAKLAPTAPQQVAPGVTAPAAVATGACETRDCATLAEAVHDPVWRLFPQDRGVRVHGWLNGGYTYNTSNPNSKFNGPYNSIDRNAEPVFNQGYAIIERGLPTTGDWGFGGRVDLLYGYDHFLGQSRGFEATRDFGSKWNGQYYGLAIPQAYVETGNDVMSLKVGHFYSTVGYESLAAVNNFFYSRAYSFQFGQPITHWGGVLTTQLTRNVQVHAGLVNGWDTLTGRGSNVNFLGGVKYTADSGNWWSSFALVSGEENNNVAGLPGVRYAPANRTRYSFLLGITPGGPCGKWEYVFHHYNAWQENGTAQGNFARWYGIDQYLYYRVSDKWRLGTRFEWFRDEDGTRVGLNRPANTTNPPLPGNYFSLTGGANFTPTANFSLRPEIRWDFTSDSVRPAFSDGRKNNQLLLGVDMILRY